MSAAAATNGRQRAPRVLPTPTEIERPAGSALAAALLAVQAAAPTLAPNADGQIQSRSYRYVTLEAVVAAVLPLLVEHELTWATFPTTDESGAPALRYRMFHVPSGEFDEDVMTLMCAHPDPQGQGSALTYARRYALVAVLNLTTGDDDDGAAASARNGTSQRTPEADKSQPTAAAPQPTARPPARSDRPATAKQRTMLRARATEAELSEGEFANVMLVAVDEPPRLWDDANAASRWVKRQLDRLPAKHVDAVLEAIAAAAEGKAAEAGRARS